MTPPFHARQWLAGSVALWIGLGRVGTAGADDALLQHLNESDQQTTPPAGGSTVRDRTQQAPEEFIPLLAPLQQPKLAMSQSQNVFHGRLRMREFYQHISNGADDLQSRLESSGSVERLRGAPLSLAWNGNISYRSGDAYAAATDHHQARLHVYQLMVAEKESDEGFSRLGRFVPLELPGLGYMDGAQIERRASDQWRFGGGMGARPERRELGLSTRELITSGYGTYESGSPGNNYYSGTLGFFQTLFSGVRDELAMLYDQRADLGPKLNAYFSSQVDFNTGSSQVHHEAARLTRADLYVTSPITSLLILRAGLNHFERPDTAAERDLSGIGNLSSFDDGYWRYWTGSTQRLPWTLQLDEEISLVHVAGQSDQSQLRGSISRGGLFWFPQAFISFTTYTLNRADGEGVGSILSGVFPLLDNRMNVTANSGFRYSAQQGQSKTLKTNDASLYLHWRVSKAWDTDLGVIQTYQDYIQSTLIDSSLSYRW